MAIYVPPSRRRARRVLAGAGFLVIGALLGFVAARATAPSLADEVRSAQERGRALAAGLRVLALHDEAQALSGNASADSELERTEAELGDAFAAAPWIPGDTRARLIEDVADLRRTGPKPGFGQRADAAARAIEQAFGIANGSAASP